MPFFIVALDREKESKVAGSNIKAGDEYKRAKDKINEHWEMHRYPVK